MSRPNNPFVLHTILGIVCLIIVLLLLPEGTDLWRRVVAGILSVGLGHHLARAILPSATRAARILLWLESLAFPLLILAFQSLPETQGWLLLATGMSWRFLVSMLFKKS